MAAQAQQRNLWLASDQANAVARGELVTVQEARPGSPWPAVWVALFIAASPEEAAAVFTDYESHVRTLPSIRQSTISRIVSPSVTEVDYTLEVPIATDEDYTVRNTVSRPGDGYLVEWVMLRARSTKATVGHASFAPYRTADGRSGTLLTYVNFVTPGSRLAAIPLVRNRALARVRETARAIRAQVERERGDSALMQPRLARLGRATDS